MPIQITSKSNPDRLPPSFRFGQFPAGEPLVIGSVDSTIEEVDVYLQATPVPEFMQLLGALDIFRSQGIEVNLHIPYFPGARQDRRDSTPLTVKIYADIINSFECKTVRIADPHSDVTTALIKNVRVASCVDIIMQAYRTAKFGMWKPTGVIAPDAGASKKVFKVAEALGVPFAQGEKHRDPATGLLSGFSVPEVEDGHWLVIDDICDAGGTFVGLQEAFAQTNPNSSLSLYVTHGIFSQGTSLLASKFDKIYTTDSFAQATDDVQIIHNFL